MAVAGIPLCAKAFKEAVSNVCAMLGLTIKVIPRTGKRSLSLPVEGKCFR